MSRETYETYSAEPEKIDLIAFLAEYFQAFRKFFLGVLILVILMGGGSFLTAKLRYQPMYEAYTSFVVGSNRAVGYSYYDNVTAQQLGKTFPYIVTSGVLKDVVARDLQVGAVTSQIEASVMENTNLFTIRVKDSSPDTAYRVLQSVITNYPEVAEYIIGATTLTVVDDSGVPVSPINSQDAVHAGMIGAAAGLAVALLLVFIYVRTRKTIRQADDVKKLTNAAFLGNLPEAKIKKRSNVKEQTITICNPKVPDSFKEAMQLIRTRTEDGLGKADCQIPTKKYAATAFLAAALAMAALIGLFSFLRDTVKNEAEFTRKIDADLLGVVYHEKKKKNSSMLITNPARSFLYVESLKRIASRVRGRLDRKGGKVLLVTSVAENEGKSTLAANLALALAEEQNRVLLLDCDFRQPALHKIFEIPEKDGKDFGKVVLGKESASGVFEKYKDTNVYTGICRNRLEEPSLAIGGEIFQRILETCRTNMDYIILDTPPMGMTADAEELAEYADAAVLSVRQDGVLTRDINDAIDALNQKEEKVIGCVFGNVYPGFGERIGNSYGYGYGYGTYSRAER